MYRRNLTIKSNSSTFLICRPELEGVQHYDACTIGHAILYHPHLSRLKTLQTPNQFPCSNCSHCSHCSHCSRYQKRNSLSSPSKPPRGYGNLGRIFRQLLCTDETLAVFSFYEIHSQIGRVQVPRSLSFFDQKYTHIHTHTYTQHILHLFCLYIRSFHSFQKYILFLHFIYSKSAHKTFLVLQVSTTTIHQSFFKYRWPILHCAGCKYGVCSRISPYVLWHNYHIPTRNNKFQSIFVL